MILNVLSVVSSALDTLWTVLDLVTGVFTFQLKRAWLWGGFKPDFHYFIPSAWENSRSSSWIKRNETPIRKSSSLTLTLFFQVICLAASLMKCEALSFISISTHLIPSHPHRISGGNIANHDLSWSSREAHMTLWRGKAGTFQQGALHLSSSSFINVWTSPEGIQLSQLLLFYLIMFIIYYVFFKILYFPDC